MNINSIKMDMIESQVLNLLKEPVLRENHKDHIFLFYFISKSNDKSDTSLYVITLKFNSNTNLFHVIGVKKKS